MVRFLPLHPYGFDMAATITLLPDKFVSRTEFLNRLRSHGWDVVVLFHGSGPVVHITGPFRGMMNCPMPVRPGDDHGRVLHDLYDIYSQYNAAHGIVGRA